MRTRGGIEIILRWCCDERPHGSHEIGPNGSTILPAWLICPGC